MARSTVGAVVAAALLMLPSPADAARTIACRSIGIPVQQLARTASVHGTLCLPSRRRTVLVLVPGATYDGTYWNIGFDPGTYNFRLAMNRAGYPTFDIDRVGTGASSTPPSALVTHERQAAALHDAVGALRAGGLGAPRFTKVIAIGHSLGSATVVTEVASYHDADAVVLTGFSHSPNSSGLLQLFNSLTPAPVVDPAFRDRDPGYLTTLPGHRGFLYGDADVSPALQAYDEATKQPVSAFEIATAFQTIAPLRSSPVTPVVKIPPTGTIDVPVLSINGSADKLFCNLATCAGTDEFTATERPYYAASPRFTGWLLPAAGHDINLSSNTRDYQREVIGWLRRLAR